MARLAIANPAMRSRGLCGACLVRFRAMMGVFIILLFSWFGRLPGKFTLRPVMKTVNPGEFAFREQFRLGFQPMLHLVPGQRTLVHITEVGLSGHFIR